MNISANRGRLSAVQEASSPAAFLPALQIQLPPSPLLHSSYSYTEAFRAESQICQPHLIFSRTHQYCLPLESKVCTSGHRLCSLRRVCSGQAGSSGLRSLPVFPDNKRRLDRVRTFTKVSCRLGKIIVPPCPVLQLRVVKPQREVYWVVGYEDGKLVARQLQGPPAGRSSAELSPDNQPHNAASSFLLYKVIYLSPA